MIPTAFVTKAGICVPSLVRSVQRGTISVTDPATTGTSTLPIAVDTRNAILYFGNNTYSAVGPSTTGSRGKLTLTDSTTVTFTVSGSAGTRICDWELIEFWPGVIRSIQRGSVTIAGASTSNTGAIDPVVPERAIAMHMGQILSGDDDQQLGRLTLTSATVLTATRVAASGSTEVQYQVVEFE